MGSQCSDSIIFFVIKEVPHGNLSHQYDMGLQKLISHVFSESLTFHCQDTDLPCPLAFLRPCWLLYNDNCINTTKGSAGEIYIFSTWCPYSTVWRVLHGGKDYSFELHVAPWFGLLPAHEKCGKQPAPQMTIDDHCCRRSCFQGVLQLCGPFWVEDLGLAFGCKILFPLVDFYFGPPKVKNSSS